MVNLLWICFPYAGPRLSNRPVSSITFLSLVEAYLERLPCLQVWETLAPCAIGVICVVVIAVCTKGIIPFYILLNCPVNYRYPFLVRGPCFFMQEFTARSSKPHVRTYDNESNQQDVTFGCITSSSECGDLTCPDLVEFESYIMNGMTLYVRGRCMQHSW